jgi:hypothetical protein
MRRHALSFILIVALLVTSIVVRQSQAAENDLVASLETLEGQVSVKRFDTQEFVTVAKESLIGVGDTIKTNGTGTARITFFANGVETDVLPNSEFRIDVFNGSEDQYTLSVSVLVGQTVQRVTKLLDSGSSYTINSTGLEMAVRGTVFDVRVENSGRSATIVRDGAVTTTNPGASDEASVPAGYGVRAEAGQGLSDVVPATNFAELDSSLDGCTGVINTLYDFRLNVRLGPSLQFARIGSLDTSIQIKLLGSTKTGEWFRIEFKNSYGWIYAPAVAIDSGCVKLREFPDDYAGEDPNSYTDLDPDISFTVTPGPTPTLLPTPTATANP